MSSYQVPGTPKYTTSAGVRRDLATPLVTAPRTTTTHRTTTTTFLSITGIPENALQEGLGVQCLVASCWMLGFRGSVAFKGLGR